MSKYPFIESITPEQEKLVTVYRDKWLQNGYKTGRLDREKAREAIDWFYESQLKKEKPIKWYCSGPLEAMLAIAYVRKIGSLGESELRNLWVNLGENLGANLQDNLWGNLQDNLRENLRDNLGANLRANLRDNLWDNLRGNLWENLWENLGENLRTNLQGNLRTNLWANLRANLQDNLWANLWDNQDINFEYFFEGNWFWGWQGFYDFILNELFKEHSSDFPEFQEYLRHLESVHLMWPFEGFCFYCDRPTEVHLDDLGDIKRLHNDEKAALLYADGTSLFSLNGVRVPEWVVTTPKEKLQAKKILEIDNAEVRTQAMKRKGLEHFDKELNVKTIHEWRDYKLLYMTVEGNETGPYLRMVNPSTAEIHTEGVGDPEKYEFKDPTIKTCQEALAFKWRCDANEVERFFKEGGVLT